FVAELLGTMILILLGGGVNANVSLDKTNGKDSGWLVITIGWGMAVFSGVFVASSGSAAHLNPAVTIGFAVAQTFDWALVPIYLAGQFLGAALGAFLVWFHYKDHYAETADGPTKLGTFSTAPAIRNTFSNLVGEIIGTFMLVFGCFYIAGATVGTESASLGALDGLPVALLVLAIGLSLGGNTGYAINPARDLSPRIMHAILPIPRKGDSDWGYSWIPVVGPILGGILAALVFLGLSA
ncbi:MAG: MIP/aquaporin family protein, partial [Bacteroidota bacterium]